jgi:hypothetical protein
MEISPICGIRGLPIVKTPPANPELTAVFDIESSSRTGDETYSSSNSNVSGGQDTDDLDDLLIEDDPGSSSVPLFSDPSNPRQVNFFA